MPPKKKTTLGNKKLLTKNKKEIQPPSLVDQLSMIANMDEDDQLVNFDSNEGEEQEQDDTSVVKRKIPKTTQPSKIPTLSPKKPPLQVSSLSNSVPVSIKKLNEEIENLFKQRDTSKLLELNRSIKGDFLKELENKYQSQLDRANKLIDKLVGENESLHDQQQLVESLRTENEILKRRLLSTSSSNTAGSVSDEESSVVFDIIELLANLSCLEFVEDEDKMQFTLKQTGNEVEMTYKLIINKSEKIDEILYIPILSKDEVDSEQVKALKKRLPDYFLGDLSFPSSNLNNFYNKISRSLNKNI